MNVRIITYIKIKDGEAIYDIKEFDPRWRKDGLSTALCYWIKTTLQECPSDKFRTEIEGITIK